MERAFELPVSLPSLRAERRTIASLHAGMKDHFGIGRIDRGECEWWGSGQVWRSGPGYVLVKEPGDVHRDIARNGPTTFTSIVLPEDELSAGTADGRAMPIAQLTPADDRAAPLHRLLDAVTAGADRFTLEVALVEAIDALARARRARPAYPRPVRRALAYLRERFAEPITLADLADYANLDKFHLCRAFRTQVGMPPHAYLTQLRVARAQAMLRRGERASDVAPLVGFYDQAQLTRHFRRWVGTTPARYAKGR